jgi:hypothetical protein
MCDRPLRQVIATKLPYVKTNTKDSCGLIYGQICGPSPEVSVGGILPHTGKAQLYSGVVLKGFRVLSRPFKQLIFKNIYYLSVDWSFVSCISDNGQCPT